MITLVPADNESFLTVAEVIARAESEFGFVTTDNPRAMSYLATQLLDSATGIDQNQADEYLVPLSDSVEMICTDNPKNDESFLKCIVVPDGPITVVNQLETNDDTNLLDRLARILHYSAVG